MQIEINREDLLAPLSTVAGVVERRQALPILSYLLLQAGKDSLALIGTDLELEMMTTVTGPVEATGSITIPARKLLDICRALPEGTRVNVKEQGGKVVVKGGRSRFSLAMLPTEDFPRVETGDFEPVIGIEAGRLRQVVEATAFCMAQQDVRYYLNGLYVQMDGKELRAVATDGHRMGIASDSGGAEAKKAIEVIVPRKAVQEILKLLPDSDEIVDIAVSSNHFRLEKKGLVFISKLIDGKFPDYNKVIPTAQGKKVSLDRGSFQEALRRVAILANEKYRGVRLNLDKGRLQISTHNPEQEEATEEIETAYDGEALEIGFNVNYLIEATGAIESDEVILGLNDPSSSCTLRASDKSNIQYIIMPMRL